MRRPRYTGGGLTVVLLLALTAAGAPAASDYPSPPFAVGARPTAVEYSLGFDGAGHSLWVGREGDVRRLRQRPDGSLAVVAVLALPGVTPIALQERWPRLFVLDRAGRVLVYERRAVDRYELTHSLPTGPEPSALHVGNDFVVVANAGSNDLSVYSWSETTFSAEVRLPVGLRPQALAAGDFAGDADLAVANAGSGTVSFVDLPASDGASAPRVSAVVPVGGAPIALVNLDLGGSFEDDLGVGDGSAPRVALWLTARGGLAPAGAIGLVDPRSRAHALGVADVVAGSRGDLVIADRGVGVVAVAAGRRARRFGRPSSVLTGIDPVGLVTEENIGGDWHDDIAVADGRGEALLRRLTPGDTLLESETAVTRLDADAGRLAWSRPGPDGQHRVAVRSGGRTRELPGAVSDTRITPSLGRWRGRPVMTYVLCRARRCAPRLWDFRARRGRTVAVPTPRGCRVSAFGVTGRWRVYELAPARGRRRCANRQRSVWMQRAGRAPRHARGGNTELGDVSRGYVVFQSWGRVPAPSDPVLRLRRLGTGRGRVVYRYGIDSQRNFDKAQISGRHVYWTDGVVEGVGDLSRSPLSIRQECSQVLRGDLSGVAHELLDDPLVDFAVDQGRLVYADDFSIFRLGGTRQRWTNCS